MHATACSFSLSLRVPGSIRHSWRRATSRSRSSRQGRRPPTSRNSSSRARCHPSHFGFLAGAAGAASPPAACNCCSSVRISSSRAESPGSSASSCPLRLFFFLALDFAPAFAFASSLASANAAASAAASAALAALATASSAAFAVLERAALSAFVPGCSTTSGVATSLPLFASQARKACHVLNTPCASRAARCTADSAKSERPLVPALAPSNSAQTAGSVPSMRALKTRPAILVTPLAAEAAPRCCAAACSRLTTSGASPLRPNERMSL
mmetsp:Transcript_48472/g.149755  ORF Transcript_48472/g.149755 Transcript_48472/m.149755 type:complete len:269 (+) Transcript_48472:195-1001(+)